MAVTWKKLAYEDDVVLKSVATTKGDLLAASGAGVITRLGVGANGKVLMADSGETTGIKWGDAATGDFKADGTVPMTGDLDFAGNDAKDMVIHTVADTDARDALTPVVGKMVWVTADLAPHVCTSAS